MRKYEHRSVVGRSMFGLLLLGSLFPAAVAEDGGQPVDPAKLERIQQTLENYLSSIQTLHVVYDQETAAKQGEKKRPKWSYDVLCRLDDGSARTFTTVHNEQGATDPRRERYHTPRKTMSFERGLKQAHITIEPGSFPPSDQLVLQAMGLPAFGCRHVRLSSLLHFPEVTRDLGEETLFGERVIVLRVGPGMPDSVLGHKDSRHTRMTLWLAPGKLYLPLRIERDVKVRAEAAASLEKRGSRVVRAPDADGAESHYVRMTFEINETRPVPDLARGGTVPFPWSVTVVSGATFQMTVTDCQVNPKVPPTAVDPEVPEDFSQIVDGETTVARLAEPANGRITIPIPEGSRPIPAGQRLPQVRTPQNGHTVPIVDPAEPASVEVRTLEERGTKPWLTKFECEPADFELVGETAVKEKERGEYLARTYKLTVRWKAARDAAYGRDVYGKLAASSKEGKQELAMNLIAGGPHPCSPSLVILSADRRSSKVLLPSEATGDVWELDPSAPLPKGLSVRSDPGNDPPLIEVSLADDNPAEPQRHELRLRSDSRRPAVLPIVVQDPEPLTNP